MTSSAVAGHCEICGEMGPSKQTREAETWDWFTGWLPATVHFCPAHKDSSERHELFRKSQVKPDRRDPTYEGSTK